jgi:hypothetical protein
MPQECRASRRRCWDDHVGADTLPLPTATGTFLARSGVPGSPCAARIVLVP